MGSAVRGTRGQMTNSVATSVGAHPQGDSTDKTGSRVLRALCLRSMQRPESAEPGVRQPRFRARAAESRAMDHDGAPSPDRLPGRCNAAAPTNGNGKGTGAVDRDEQVERRLAPPGGRGLELGNTSKMSGLAGQGPAARGSSTVTARRAAGASPRPLQPVHFAGSRNRLLGVPRTQQVDRRCNPEARACRDRTERHREDGVRS